MNQLLTGSLIEQLDVTDGQQQSLDAVYQGFCDDQVRNEQNVTKAKYFTP